MHNGGYECDAIVIDGDHTSVLCSLHSLGLFLPKTRISEQSKYGHDTYSRTYCKNKNQERRHGNHGSGLNILIDATITSCTRNDVCLSPTESPKTDGSDAEVWTSLA
jgi:hypothetical protein